MIRDILLLQKRELEKRRRENYVERAVSIKGMDSSIIKVVIGPRRSGKSFFSIRMLDRLGRFGYVNFDDEKLVDLENYNEIVDVINSLYGNPKYLLFDEIQNLRNWELFVNRLQRQNYNLIITGSNSNLLSRELASHLTGRHICISLLPFSFREFLNFEKKELTESEIREKLHVYIKYGGYPEPLVKDMDYKDYLSTLFNSIIYKDIIKRFKIRSAAAIEDMAVYLISNAAKEFSYNTLAKVTKCKSVRTVEKYLGYLEETFIFFRLNSFSYKIKNQLASNKKIYCIDNGFIYAKAFKFMPEMGNLYENAVAIELKRREMNNGISIYYWKNPQQEEVDFVVKQGLKVKQLIQVCYSIDNIKTKEREVRALLKAGKELKCKNLTIITHDHEAEKDIEWFGIKGRIKFIPLWKWMLAEK